ncbi:MAG: hypothetical protein QNK04_18900 [Myxococcota bacterium]|nr:hypothetical protein [Myxococcota bacterium]
MQDYEVLEEAIEGIGDEDDREFFGDESDEVDAELMELAASAIDDEEAEEEFLGALAGLAAKALPAIASTVVPQVIRFGRRLFRGGRRRRRRAARTLPRVVRRSIPAMRRRARTIRRRPQTAQMIMAQVLRLLRSAGIR